MPGRYKDKCMCRINILIFIILSAFSLSSFAQEDDEFQDNVKPAVVTSAPSPWKRWALGVSLLQWNESLLLEEGVKSEKDFANFSGLMLSAEKEFHFTRWGLSLGGFLSTGRAVGGGNSSVIVYEQSKVAYSMLGINPRVFYHLSGRMAVGLSALIYNRQMTWPTDNTPLLKVTSGRSTNAVPMLDLNIRIFKNWDFYQGLGTVSDGATMWRLGLHYRM